MKHTATLFSSNGVGNPISARHLDTDDAPTWKVCILDKNYRDVLARDGTRIAIIARHLDEKGRERKSSKDNARLIAKSPELLELARQIVLAVEIEKAHIPADIEAAARALVSEIEGVNR